MVLGLSIWTILVIVGGVIFLLGIRIVRPTHRGLIETFGKYTRYANAGFNWIIPVIQRLIQIDITETMVNAKPQQIITKDKLNATVDAQVYFKVKPDEISVKASQYNVFNYFEQIVNLARTTLRNIIGTMNLTEANSDRNKINNDLMITLTKETKNWGIDVVRTELKEIDPPQDVQDTMNKVVKAENEKIAALDFASATETRADGERRATIKQADGEKQSRILRAEGEAKAITTVAEATAQQIKLVNESLQKYFKNEAQDFKKLETAQIAFEQGTKYIIDSKSNITNVISDVAGIIPTKRR